MFIVHFLCAMFSEVGDDWKQSQNLFEKWSPSCWWLLIKSRLTCKAAFLWVKRKTLSKNVWMFEVFYHYFVDQCSLFMSLSRLLLPVIWYPVAALHLTSIQLTRGPLSYYKSTTLPSYIQYSIFFYQHKATVVINPVLPSKMINSRNVNICFKGTNAVMFLFKTLYSILLSNFILLLQRIFYISYWS